MEEEGVGETVDEVIKLCDVGCLPDCVVHRPMVDGVRGVAEEHPRGVAGERGLFEVEMPGPARETDGTQWESAEMFDFATPRKSDIHGLGDLAVEARGGGIVRCVRAKRGG